MRRKKINYQLVLVILLIIIVIPWSRDALGAGLKFVAKPMMVYFSEKGLKHYRFFNGIYNIRNLSRENRELSNKLKSSIVDQSQLNELKVENEQLKKQIGFSGNQHTLELIPSQIIGRDPATFMDYIVVDKGSDDGVVEGKAVLSEGILVGRVKEVEKNQSKIVLITSKDSIIQAMVQRSRAMGVLKGGLVGMTLENIPQDTEAIDSEIVITSGLGGGIEQGIVIGTISGQKSGEAEIFKVFSIKSLIDFNKLEMVFIQKET